MGLPMRTVGLPEGNFAGIEAAKRCREVMSKPVIQFDLEAKLTDPLETNNPDMVGLFPGAKTYSEG